MLEHIDKDAAPQRLHHGRMVDEDVQGVGRVLLLREVALAFALRHALVDNLVSLFLAFNWQRAKILRKQGSDRVGIDIAHEVVFKVACIGKALTIHLEQTVVVDAVEVFFLEALSTDIIIINHADDAVLQSRLRIEVLVLQSIARAFHRRSEGIIITTR